MNRSRNDRLDNPDFFDEWIDRVCEADPLPLYVEDPLPPSGPPLSADERGAAWVQLVCVATATRQFARMSALWLRGRRS